jgi:hypothetical protein
MCCRVHQLIGVFKVNIMFSFVYHCISVLLVLFYSLVALVPSCHAATNLALGKTYTVSPLATYPYTAPSTDSTALTDGKYTVGRFWIQQTTVGWRFAPTVEILIDLEKVSIIDSITFNTARETSSAVYYPPQIHAFVGPDKEHLQYVGDIADHPDNLPGTYQTKKFRLDSIKAKGRYVLLEIAASKSRYVFCDEIEVLEGTQDSGKTGTLSIEASRKLAVQLKWPDIEQKHLMSFLRENGEQTDDREASVQRQLAIVQKLESSGAINSTIVLDAELLSVRGAVLRNRFPKPPLLLESVDPWGALAPYAPVSGLAPQQLSLVAPAGGYDHKAVTITNTELNPQNVSLSLAAMPSGSPALTLYQNLFVKSISLEYVADPLVPETTFILLPGESRVVFISARGNTPGEWNSSLNISTGKFSVSIPVNCQVKKVTLPEIMTLNSVNWGYLRFGLISDRKTQAVKDLFAHHTRVVVVPNTHLTGGNLQKIATINDFLVLESYLKQHQGASRLLLLIALGTMDHKTSVGKYPFLSREWQDEFKKWYANALLAAGRAGFSESQIYLYPYDEIAGEQIDDFIRLATWANVAIPTARFYLTFGDETYNSKRWDGMLPLLDIVQAAHEETLLGKSGSLKGEAWIYNADGMTRSLSPYTYYRLKAWKAFLRGYTGIGFWNYAEIGAETTAWKEVQDDYAVIYEGPGSSIVSSRRWEAWRMGIEDYELLTMYAKAKGITAAKELAASVFNFSEDTTRADEARRRILTELSALAVPPAPGAIRRTVK